MNIIACANGDRDLIQQLFVTSSVVLRKTKIGEDTLYSETSDSKLQMLKVKNCHPLLKMVRPPKQKQGVKRTNQFICKPCGTSFDSCAKRRKHYLTVDHKPESFAEKKETRKLICRKCSETFITDQDRKAHYYRKHITSSTEAILKRKKVRVDMILSTFHYSLITIAGALGAQGAVYPGGVRTGVRHPAGDVRTLPHPCRGWRH